MLLSKLHLHIVFLLSGMSLHNKDGNATLPPEPTQEPLPNRQPVYLPSLLGESNIKSMMLIQQATRSKLLTHTDFRPGTIYPTLGWKVRPPN